MVEATNPTTEVSTNDTPAVEQAQVVEVQQQVEEEEEKKVEETTAAATTGTPTTIASGLVPLPKTLRGQFLYGQSLKEEGNLYFKQKDYANAIKKYGRVRAFLKPMIPSGDGQGGDNSQFLNMISA